MKKIFLLLILLMIQACTNLKEVQKNEKGYHSSGYINVRGDEQYLKIRADDTNKPILLYLHGGPFEAKTPAIDMYYKKLQKDFIVVYWDQRGSGKSYSKESKIENFSIDMFVEDAKEVTEYLCKKFAKEKIYIHGHSWGSILGLNLVKKYPQYYYAYIGDGQVVNMQNRWSDSYDLLIKKFEEDNKKNKIKKMKKIEKPDIEKIEKYYEKSEVKISDIVEMKKNVKYINYLNKTRNSSYSIIKPYILGARLELTWAYNPILNIFRKRNDTNLTLEIIKENFMEESLIFDIPIYFFVGKHDLITPYTQVEKYFEIIEAPKKDLIWFEKSAHTPHIEESKKFYDMMKQVQKETLTK